MDRTSYPIFSQDEFISRFVGRILEDLWASFAGATIERLGALRDPREAARIARRVPETLLPVRQPTSRAERG